MKKYRILKNSYYDSFQVKKVEYSVQVKKKFLWYEYWSTLKETICGMGDCYKVIKSFDSESEAAIAIKQLEDGHPMEGWVQEVSQEITL